MRSAGSPPAIDTSNRGFPWFGWNGDHRQALFLALVIEPAESSSASRAGRQAAQRHSGPLAFSLGGGLRWSGLPARRNQLLVRFKNALIGLEESQRGCRC